MNYEFKTLICFRLMDEELNLLGKEGWDLVSVTTNIDKIEDFKFVYNYTYFFKRSIAQVITG